jgi:hypothetical protein
MTPPRELDWKLAVFGTVFMLILAGYNAPLQGGAAHRWIFTAMCMAIAYSIGVAEFKIYKKRKSCEQTPGAPSSEVDDDLTGSAQE